MAKKISAKQLEFAGRSMMQAGWGGYRARVMSTTFGFDLSFWNSRNWFGAVLSTLSDDESVYV